MKFTCKDGSLRLWFGNYPVVVPQGTEVDFETVTSVDALAEVLATNVAAYSVHRDSLAHEEDGFDDGKPIKVYVSYGASGARVEQKPEHVAALAETQAANVAEADAALETQIKADEQAAKEAAARAPSEEEAARAAALELQAKEHARLGADAVLAQTGEPPVVVEKKEA